jgi:hypothetical protein
MSAPSRRKVWVERCKWPDRPHYGVEGYLLGEDEHGRWVGVHEGGPVHRGEEILFEGQYRVVLCIPRNDWFMAHWLAGHEIEIYVDIVTPPVWTSRGATMVDLDFDVVVIGGEATLVDEDEFEEHRVAYRYPEELVSQARTAAADVFERVLSHQPPFTMDAAVRWHAQLDALES